MNEFFKGFKDGLQDQQSERRPLSHNLVRLLLVVAAVLGYLALFVEG